MKSGTVGCPIKWRSYFISYSFIFPSICFVALFLYYPVWISLIHSFTKWNLVHSEWIGLNNFYRMFQDDIFIKGLRNQAIYTLTDLAKHLFFPLLAAELIYLLSKHYVRYFFRTAFVMPMLLPGVVTILLWLSIYNPANGMLNHLLKFIGLSGMERAWLGDSETAIWAIVFKGFPFIAGLPFLIFYAGIGNIKQELIEAAKIDGAVGWKVFLKIHLPLLLPQIRVVMILTFISSMQDFVKIFVMTGGGPGAETTIPSLIMYHAAFSNSEYGYGSAIGIFLFVVILLFTLVSARFLKADY